MEQLTDSINMKGDVTIKVWDVDRPDIIKRQFEIKNLIVSTGKYHIAARLANMTNDGAYISHMAIGTGTTSPTLTDTALSAQLSSRVSVTLDHVAGTNYMTASAVFLGSTYQATAITEAGLFTDLTNTTNSMVCRTSFGAFSIGSSEIIGISWKITII